MKISEIKIGMKLNHPLHGEGFVISKTVRTVSAQFANGLKSKITYRNNNDSFNICHF